MTENTFSLNIEDMTNAGLQTGHFVAKLHPKMKEYVLSAKNNVHIIDLDKTLEKLAEALQYISGIISERKNLLIVGTKIPLKEMVLQTAKECGLPYVNERWLGGALTNFDTILKRVNYFKDLEKQKATGELAKYTKKERMNFDKEIESLRIKFEGIKDMTKLPEAVLVLDMRKDILAAKEARKRGIKIIAICDTNTDPDLIDYPIPANDDAASSIKYILEKVKEAVLNAKSKTQMSNDESSPKP